MCVPLRVPFTLPQVPSTVSGPQLLSLPLSALPSATRLAFNGEYTKLRPADLLAFIRQMTANTQQGSTGAQGHAAQPQGSHTQVTQVTQLDLCEMQLQQPPLPVSALQTWCRE